MSKQVEHYKLEEVLGSGQFGKVYKALNIKDNVYYAVKVVKRSIFEEQPKLKQFTVYEIQSLSKINHKNVIKFMEMLKTANHIYFVYEYCSSGNLEKDMMDRGHYSEPEALEIFKQIVDGFKAINEHNILHRDLKPQNIFLSGNTVKIGDFGFCKPLRSSNDMAKTMLGSPIYMAPEILLGKEYGLKADIWSLGVVLYEMLFEICPFEEKSIGGLINLLESTELNFPPNFIISQKTINLLRRLLEKDPAKRISWQELFSMFLKETESNPTPPNVPLSDTTNINSKFDHLLSTPQHSANKDHQASRNIVIIPEKKEGAGEKFKTETLYDLFSRHSDRSPMLPPSDISPLITPNASPTQNKKAILFPQYEDSKKDENFFLKHQAINPFRMSEKPNSTFHLQGAENEKNIPSFRKQPSILEEKLDLNEIKTLAINLDSSDKYSISEINTTISERKGSSFSHSQSSDAIYGFKPGSTYSGGLGTQSNQNNENNILNTLITNGSNYTFSEPLPTKNVSFGNFSKINETLQKIKSKGDLIKFFIFERTKAKFLLQVILALRVQYGTHSNELCIQLYKLLRKRCERVKADWITTFSVYYTGIPTEERDGLEDCPEIRKWKTIFSKEIVEIMNIDQKALNDLLGGDLTRSLSEEFAKVLDLQKLKWDIIAFVEKLESDLVTSVNKKEIFQFANKLLDSSCLACVYFENFFDPTLTLEAQLDYYLLDKLELCKLSAILSRKLDFLKSRKDFDDFI